MSAEEIKLIPLTDIIEQCITQHPKYCHPTLHREWEIFEAIPCLLKKGYTILEIGFHTNQSLDFNPQARGIMVRKDEIYYIIWYEMKPIL
jgi:hypothetical protein